MKQKGLLPLRLSRWQLCRRKSVTLALFLALATSMGVVDAEREVARGGGGGESVALGRGRQYSMLYPNQLPGINNAGNERQIRANTLGGHGGFGMHAGRPTAPITLGTRGDNPIDQGRNGPKANAGSKFDSSGELCFIRFYVA